MKNLDGGIGFIGDCADFLKVQLAGQHQLGKAGLIEELRSRQGTDVGLGAGVQFDGGNVQLHHAEVLNDQRVDAGVVQFVDQLASRFQLVVVQDGVDRGEHPCVVTVCEFNQFGDIAHFVAGVVTGAKAGAADINGVCAVQDGLARDGGVAGGAEQFEVMLR